MVFFVQNNGYAISVPLSKQTAAPSLAHKGSATGFPAMLVDGNDAAAVYAAVREAVGVRRGRRRAHADRGAHLSHRGAHQRR